MFSAWCGPLYGTVRKMYTKQQQTQHTHTADDAVTTGYESNAWIFLPEFPRKCQRNCEASLSWRKELIILFRPWPLIGILGLFLRLWTKETSGTSRRIDLQIWRKTSEFTIKTWVLLFDSQSVARINRIQTDSQIDVGSGSQLDVFMFSVEYNTRLYNLGGLVAGLSVGVFWSGGRTPCFENFACTFFLLKWKFMNNDLN